MMKEVIELLKKKGFVEDLQHCIDATSAMVGIDEKAQMAACKDTLIDFIAKLDEDDELNNKFFEFSMDLAAEAIMKELDLKANKDYKPTEIEKLIAGLALVKMMKEDK